MEYNIPKSVLLKEKSTQLFSICKKVTYYQICFQFHGELTFHEKLYFSTFFLSAFYLSLHLIIFTLMSQMTNPTLIFLIFFLISYFLLYPFNIIFSLQGNLHNHFFHIFNQPSTNLILLQTTNSYLSLLSLLNVFTRYSISSIFNFSPPIHSLIHYNVVSLLLTLPKLFSQMTLTVSKLPK